jgi:hypothetical protein
MRKTFLDPEPSGRALLSLSLTQEGFRRMQLLAPPNIFLLARRVPMLELLAD